MSVDDKKKAFQDLMEFANKKESGSKAPDPNKSEPALAEGRSSSERDGVNLSSPSEALPRVERKLYQSYKEELLFIIVAQLQTGAVSKESFAFSALIAMLQVPELRERLAKWLGRPAPMISEGEQIAEIRQSLREAVTLKPPGGQSQDHWYAFQLGQPADKRPSGFDDWVSQLTAPWLKSGSFQEFLKAFTKSAREKNPAFEEWLRKNTKPLSYRMYREAASSLLKAISSQVKGQSAAVDGVCDGYAQSILRKAAGPRGVFTLLGAPGTGKTFLAETFAETLPEVDGEHYQVLKFSMEQFNHARANSLLFGSGHVYSEAALGQLTDAVRSVPKSIVIFDEIEKAHPEVVQSLLGVLDRGIAKDETSLKEADFSRAFIFFTTNLGQQALAKRRESGQALGALDAQNVAGILQVSEENPRGLSPEFLSRLGKGKFLVFEELPASSLIEIYQSAWNRAAQDSQIETPVPRCTTQLATLHLLTHLPALSARAAASAPERDVIEYLDRALEEFDASGGGRDGSDLTRSKTVGVKELLDGFLEEYDLQSPVTILLIDDDDRTQDLLRDQLEDVRLRVMDQATEADELFSESKPDLILLDLLIHARTRAKGRGAALHQAITLRARFPDSPMLVFGLDAENSSRNRELFRMAKIFEGVSGVVNYRSSETDKFVRWVSAHVERIRCARLLTALRRSRKHLSFSWKGRVEGACLIMSPDLVKTEKAVAPEDVGGVVGMGDIPQERLSDVVGNERAVDTVFRAVGWLSKPKEIEKFGIRPPSGYLLEGPPGTGKTFLAKAVAGECGLPFFNVNGADFVQKYYGESGRLVKELFAKARQYAPSIIFIDEIDAFATSRDKGQRPDVSGINALLSEMDGFDNRKQPVLVLAATNYRSRLDPALLRAGRFDEVIVCDLPNKAARLEMIKRGYQKAGLTVAEDAIESLAMRTQGSSAADIDALIREAIYQAVSEGREPAEKDVDEACSRVVYGAVRTDLKLAKEEKWSVACHEAGHAIAVHVATPQKQLDYLSIQPRSESLGFVSYRHESDNARGSLSNTVSEIKAEMVVALAGREAERLMLGAEKMSSGATSDLRRANALAYHAIAECGLDSELGPVSVNLNQAFSEQFSEQVAARLRHWLSEAETQCRELLAEHQAQLRAVADLLYEHESLDGQGFREIVCD